MLEEMKNDTVIKEYVEVTYREQAGNLLQKLWGNILQGTDVSINQKEFDLLMDEVVENMYIALQLAFDSVEDLRTYIEFVSQYKEQQDLVGQLTEKSTKDLLPESRMLKIFNL